MTVANTLAYYDMSTVIAVLTVLVYKPLASVYTPAVENFLL